MSSRRAAGRGCAKPLLVLRCRRRDDVDDHRFGVGYLHVVAHLDIIEHHGVFDLDFGVAVIGTLEQHLLALRVEIHDLRDDDRLPRGPCGASARQIRAWGFGDYK